MHDDHCIAVRDVCLPMLSAGGVVVVGWRHIVLLSQLSAGNNMSLGQCQVVVVPVAAPAVE